MEYNENEKLRGKVEIDGIYVGNYIKPANNINDRIDRRKVYKPNKRVVISMRERHNIKGLGATKTKIFVLKSENIIDINRAVNKHMVKGSEIHSDENSAYDDLFTNFSHKVVNHQIEYSGLNGENNNQSESFNDRFRRLLYGQIHKVSVLYLSSYANEIAYRKDTRTWNNKKIVDDIIYR